MPILRTEALLRLSDPYISATQVFFDAGGVPPPYLDEAVELQALQMHGVDPTKENLDTYRAAARELPLDTRAEIFFLHANDQLFRPYVDLRGQLLQGSVFPLSTDLVEIRHRIELKALLGDMPRALLVASTSS